MRQQQRPDSRSVIKKEREEEREEQQIVVLLLTTHNITVLGVCMDQSELVVIDDSGIEGPDRPKDVRRHDPTFSGESESKGSQSKRLSDAINPLYSRQAKLVFSCLSDASDFETFLNGMLKNVWLCHLDK